MTTERVWNAKQSRLQAAASTDHSHHMRSQAHPLTTHQFHDVGSPPAQLKHPGGGLPSHLQSFDLCTPPDQRLLPGGASQPHQAKHLSSLLNSSIHASDVMNTANQSMIPVELAESSMFSVRLANQENYPMNDSIN